MAYCTADETLTSLDGLQVIPLRRFGEVRGKIPLVFINNADTFSLKVWEYFAKSGFTPVHIRDMSYADAVYGLITSHLSDISDVWEWLDESDGSREGYLAYIEGRLSSNMSRYRCADEQQYFYAPFLPKAGDIVIDGGAFDGATAADFVSLGCRVYSFELDSENFPKVLGASKKYGFTAENMGLSARRTSMRYVHSGGASRVYGATSDGDVGSLIDIDTYVREKGLPRVDFIKLDVEGSEPDALCGAMGTISRWKPRMAVCMYHREGDIWGLAKYIKSVRPDYEFSFRHYPLDARESADWRRGIGNLVEAPYGLDGMIRCEYEAVLYAK